MATQQLEDRNMLAADNPYHNDYFPSDVDADGSVTVGDALAVINSLLTLGPHDLMGTQSSTRGNPDAEGEPDTPMYVDVNSDNYLDTLDAIIVINDLLSGVTRQPDMVAFTIEVTNTSGQVTPIIGINQQFIVNVYVEDVRTVTDPATLGVFAAYVDMTFDQLLVNVPNAATDITFGPAWLPASTDVDGVTVGGEIDEAQAVQNGTTPLGPGPFLFFSTTFTAGSTPGTAVFQTNAADILPAHQTLLFDPPMPVPLSEFNFGSGSVQIINTNQAVDDTFATVFEDSSNNPLDVLGNDVNVTGTLTVTAVGAGSAAGTITVGTGGANIVYTPAADFVGTETFTYTISDGSGGSSTATVTVNVQNSNDDPDAVDDSFSINENQSITFNVLANDTSAPDPPETLTITGVSTPNQGGSVSISGGGTTIDYTPLISFVGTETFTYTISDGNGGTDTATVTVNVNELVLDVKFRVEATDILGNVQNTFSVGDNFLINVYVQDTRVGSGVPDANRGVFSAYLDLLFDDAMVTFVPGSPENVIFGPNYQTLTDDGTVLTGILNEIGATQTVPSGSVDPALGPGEFLFFTAEFTADAFGMTILRSDPADGTLHDVLLFDPPNPEVPDSRINYGGTKVTFIIGDPPVGNDDTYSTNEDTTLTVNAAAGVLANDTDADFDPLTASLVSGVSNGTLTFNPDGSFTYVPNANFFGTDSFVYMVDDGTGGTDTATATITVLSQNDLPVAVNDAYSTDEDVTLTVNAANGVLNNDTDVENDPLTAVLGTNVSNGTLTFNADGSFTYVPDPGFIGVDSFTYFANDGTGNSNEATVLITVGMIVPGPISGYVYMDVNNNGIYDQGELGVGGVEIHLTGTDILSNPVDVVTTTNPDGSYAIDVNPGSYVLSQVQPQHLIDGQESLGIGGTGSLIGNDVFQLLSFTGVAQGYNFGELGLSANYIGPWHILASEDDEGTYAAFYPDGTTKWYATEGSWAGFASIDLTYSALNKTLTIMVEDQGGAMYTAVVSTLGDNRIMPMYNGVDGTLFRIDGSPDDFGFPVPTTWYNSPTATTTPQDDLEDLINQIMGL